MSLHLSGTCAQTASLAAIFRSLPHQQHHASPQHPMRFLTTRLRPRVHSSLRPSVRRALLTLAIETSCDDTSVAILETKTCAQHGHTCAVLHFHKKITSNNTSFHGIHPIVSLYSHQENLALLLDEALLHLPFQNTSIRKVPDFVAVTRGPGMRSNLFTGMDTAKGLAVAWQRPLVGVHHMQAHALTPRLVKALQNSRESEISYATSEEKAVIASKTSIEPDFPFLSVLASGGHTLLIYSATLTDHKVLASTTDIAVGECLDKIARSVLPEHILQTAPSAMYGPLLEKFAFPETPKLNTDKTLVEPKIEVKPGEGAQRACPHPHHPVRAEYQLESSTAREYTARYGTRYDYVVPRNNEEAPKQNSNSWGWVFNRPLSKGAGGLKSNSMEMSFTGLLTAVERVVEFETDKSSGKITKIPRLANNICNKERRDMAREAMRVAFEHVASRVVLALEQTSSEKLASAPITTVVMAGGVAANSYLRFILASMLSINGFSHVKLVFPPVSLCTDNAAMIAWAGIEMYNAGYRDSRTIRSVRKWPLDQMLSPPID
ncbi:hypothetical protein K504DRAFT_467669 [Pleomassaria siparia CBS 279.74]|uniref:N(6)-L-threonylcarbamoyladenine synthase n=1 Tax=Pleomassaria siparia CBS 279.74 TaxID=1314801 RepID=A0A6G1KA83_9PLEO|nr:hypothetical protein K504DRAFT_467669 [Pleomassaria siparia CBS 279.74]